MFPQQLSSFQFYQKKKDIVLYKAQDPSHNYILKSIITKDSAVKQAFYDEYYTLNTLFHPSLPVYYGIEDHFRFPDREGEYLTLCMEDCSVPENNTSVPLSCDIQDLLKIMDKTAQVLSFLLDKGVLYTDLNPSNLIISKTKSDLHITLVDFTYCYYFLRNPYPDYDLRFSYNLSPNLKGQQLLIQELTFLFHELIEKNHIRELPFFVYQLLETGANPTENLSLHEFSLMLQKRLV